MVLQLYRPICELVAVFRAVGRVQAGIVIYGVVVVDSHAVVVNGKGRVAYEAVSVKFCGVELDVVGLPRLRARWRRLLSAGAGGKSSRNRTKSPRARMS